jgi:hypothetical protein
MVAVRARRSSVATAATPAGTAPATATVRAPVPATTQAVQPPVQAGPVVGGASPTQQITSTTELVLSWIGFDKVKQRKSVLEELGPDLSDFLQLTERELDGLGKTLSTKTPVVDKVSIGLQRMKKLKAVIYWAKDRHRTDMPVTIDISVDTTEAKTNFLQALVTSTERHFIREEARDSLETRAKNASPGKLKDESKWEAWEGALRVMLGILQGVNHVPLTYVIREDEHEDGAVYDNFVDECIARASLEGPHFNADARQVHQIIQSLTSAENAEHWLKDISKKHNGRLDMMALRSHYRGAGNQSRRIGAAEKLRSTLHYRNERSLKFSQFISQTKNMFNIYEECNEAQPETVKLRFLFDKTEATVLQTSIEVMKAQLGQDEGCWTFVAACDHLASQIPAEGSGPRAKIAASASGSHPHGDTKSCMMRDGKIHTGSYTHEEWFNVLNHDERSKVMVARNKLNGNQPKKAYKPKQDAKSSRKIKSLQKTIKKRDSKISSMQRTTDDDEETSDSESSAEPVNAGTKFGGKASKRRTKKKQKKN